jgi:putative addiction module component (TIGR02574 family)
MTECVAGAFKTRLQLCRCYLLGTSITELRQLPVSEKLRIIEALWDDIAAKQEDYESPAWHEAELLKTEKDYREGRLASVDWEDAKKALRARFE